MNCIKRQNGIITKDESPRLEGVHMLQGTSRELLIAPERMMWLGQSGSDAQLWVCQGMKIKSDAAKNSIA